jgi:hypothetical protein
VQLQDVRCRRRIGHTDPILPQTLARQHAAKQFEMGIHRSRSVHLSMRFI